MSSIRGRLGLGCRHGRGRRLALGVEKRCWRDVQGAANSRIGIDRERWVVAMFNSAIHISSMANMDNGDGLLGIVDIVEHPIIPHPQAPSFTARQLS